MSKGEEPLNVYGTASGRMCPITKHTVTKIKTCGYWYYYYYYYCSFKRVTEHLNRNDIWFRRRYPTSAK